MTRQAFWKMCLTDCDNFSQLGNWVVKKCIIIFSVKGPVSHDSLFLLTISLLADNDSQVKDYIIFHLVYFAPCEENRIMSPRSSFSLTH